MTIPTLKPATVLVLLLAAPLTSCSLITDPFDPCGEHVFANVDIDEHGSLHPLDSGFFIGSRLTSENRRQYIWRVRGTNVCTHRHIDFHVLLGTRNGQVPFGVTVKEEHSLLYENVFSVREHAVSEGKDWESSGDFGVRDAYGDGPGEFSLLVQASLPTTGVESVDHQYARDHVRGLSMSANFHRHKD